MNRLLRNLTWALRSLAGTPGFTALAVLLLALGIGANAAIFSLVDRVLLRPLDYPEPQAVMALYGAHLEDGEVRNSLSPADFLDWQRESTRFAALAAVANTAVNLTGGPEPVRAYGLRVSWTFFRVLGVQPALGRGFLPAEDRAGGPRAVVLSHDFWMRHFGGDPAAVGRTVALDGADTPVVGVMPKGFRFEYMGNRRDVLVPAAFTAEETGRRGWRFLGVVGRVAPGATRASAEEELRAIAARAAIAHPDSNRKRSARVFPLQGELVRDTRTTLLLLQGAVFFVLLVAMANLMNLLLARRARQRRDLAIRAALGASPWDLSSQAFAESALLGLLGGAAGLLLAQGAMAALVRLLGLSGDLRVLGWDPRLAAFTFLLALAASLALGFVPALLEPGGVRADQLKEGRTSGAGVHHRLRGLLVVSELALTTLLLVGAGLMLRSLHHLQTVDPGFRPDGLLMASLTLPERAYPTLADRAAFVRRLQERVEAIPGVVAAGANDTLPFAGSTWTTSYDVEGQPPGERRVTIAHHVSPGYFAAMGIPILQGRDMGPGETGGLVVSRRFARKHFGDGDPLGRGVSLGIGDAKGWQRVVGVVGDVRHNGLARESDPEAYLPLGAGAPAGKPLAAFALVVRCQGAPLGLAPSIRKALRETDPDLPLGSVQAMADLLEQDRRTTRAAGVLLTVFASLALLLAGVGIYAVLGFLAEQRRRELGIRRALGATGRDILALVLGQGLRLVSGGIACGLLGALALGRLIQSQVHGVAAGDPATLGAVALLLAGVGLGACLVPALRALRVDPGTVLRSE